MMHLNEDNEIDVVTLMDQLSTEGMVDEAGGPQYLLQSYVQMCQTTRNVQCCTDIVSKHALKRRLIRTAGIVFANDGYNDELELDAILSDKKRRILELSSSRESDGFKDIRDVLGQVYETAEELISNHSRTPGIPTGYRDLDQMTAGFNRNDLIILAARPSVGKTAFTLILHKKLQRVKICIQLVFSH